MPPIPWSVLSGRSTVPLEDRMKGLVACHVEPDIEARAVRIGDVLRHDCFAGKTESPIAGIARIVGIRLKHQRSIAEILQDSVPEKLVARIGTDAEFRKTAPRWQRHERVDAYVELASFLQIAKDAGAGVATLNKSGGDLLLSDCVETRDVLNRRDAETIQVIDHSQCADSLFRPL
jgi:hypothetical protein